MDSIRSLMDKKQYELVIKLTENDKDVTNIFYRISALVGNNQPLEALRCIKDNRDILKKRLSFLMKVHIEILCILEKFDEAYDEMDYYSNLPYESQEVEEMLKFLPQYIKSEERKTFGSRQLSDDEINQQLKSEDRNAIIFALDAVRDRDVNAFFVNIQNILLNFPNQTVRSFALLTLVEKATNQIVHFNHNGNIIDINPTLLKTPFDKKLYDELGKRMQILYKNPSVANHAIEILSSYLIYTYPDEIKENIDVLAIALYKIACDYLQIVPEHSIDEMSIQTNTNINEIEALIDKISSALNDF